MNDFFKELTGYLLGNVSAAYCIAAIVYVLVGAAIHILYDVQTRYKLNFNSPITFSWNYFYTKNKLRFILNITVAVLSPILYATLIGNPLEMKYCFAIGLVFDVMYVVIKKLTKRMKDIVNQVLNMLDKYLPNLSIKSKN